MKHKLRILPDINVDEKVGVSPGETKCEKCGQKIKVEKKKIYVCKFLCPHCKKEHTHESNMPVIQFKVICPCQTEFNCFVIKNKVLKL